VTNNLVDRPAPESRRDPYRGVVLLLALVAFIGAVSVAFGGVKLGNPVVLDAALLLALATAALSGVAMAQAARLEPPGCPPPDETPVPDPVGEVGESPPQPRSPEEAVESGQPNEEKKESGSGSENRLKKRRWLTATPSRAAERAGRWLSELGNLGVLRRATADLGAIAVLLLALASFQPSRPAGRLMILGAVVCAVGVGIAAAAAHYLAAVAASELPEAPGLARGARMTAWVLALAALAVGFEWIGQEKILQALHLLVLATIAWLCYGLFRTRVRVPGELAVFSLDLPVLSALGGRPNVLAGLLDAAEQQLGIDLRSTWALRVVRGSVEPLVIGLALLGWLSTSLTVVHVAESGLIERFGVPVPGRPLPPGLHLHWPWPADRIFLSPVRRVQALHVGHEGEETEGPENVLWARKHAENEYTLLLGNGRDLISIDAMVQFRILDARAWLYSCQNPASALRDIAYRAVMRNTVNRTLDEALSQNVVAVAERMRAMVQREADSLGLGVQVVAFTIGGMHPPVPVAPDYQAVVSAELGKTTAVVDAEAFRNQTVPAAEAEVISGLDSAQGDGATSLATAAGRAWSFRTLEAQFRAAPGEYFFRRRLETLERGLAGKRFIVVDSRIQRDGGELWLIP
jgi:regulator of protease activity HflC (stomatin/prohibitin superfamily)